MKLKELTFNLFGTEIKIKIGAAEKASEENPGTLIEYQSLSDFLTPDNKDLIQEAKDAL